MVSRLDLLRRVPLFSMLTTSQAVSVADAVVKQRETHGMTSLGEHQDITPQVSRTILEAAL